MNNFFNKRAKKRKSHFDLKSRTQIYMNKKSIEELIQEVQTYCNSLGLEITKVTIMKNVEKNQNVLNSPEIVYIDQKNNLIDIRKNRTIKALQAKDLSNLSDRGYNIFLQNFKNEFFLPSIKELYDLKKELKSLFKVENNVNGVFNSPRDKIYFVCERFIKLNGNFENDNITLKLSGDSINITRTGIKLINFTFAIIDDREKPMSADGNYILGLLLKLYILNLNFL